MREELFVIVVASFATTFVIFVVVVVVVISCDILDDARARRSHRSRSSLVITFCSTSAFSEVEQTCGAVGEVGGCDDATASRVA